MNYKNWKRVERSVGGLSLDPQNPRIPPANKTLGQPELIEELTLHDDVLELAKNIAANGYFPNEPLIAVKEHQKLVVVEGNRRLAACKLLLHPELAPQGFSAKFRTAAATFDQNILRKIPVLIAPSRDATIPLIIARHTATQIATWKPAMQAHFYHTLIQGGLSIDDVAQKFRLTSGEVRKELQSHNLYMMACRLDLPAPEAEVVRDPRKFKLTTLNRIFETPDARKFFGVDFTDDGKVAGIIDPNEFKKGFAKAVSDVAQSKVDSRTLNTPQEIKQYLGGYDSAQTPDLKKRGTFDSTTFMVTGMKRAPSKARKGKSTRSQAVVPKGLIPRDIVCNSRNARIRALFDELRRLSPLAFPNSASFAFRSLLELSVSCYLDDKGESAKMKSEQQAKITAYNANVPAGKPKRSLPSDWTPELSEMLKWLLDSQKNLIPQGHVSRALSQAIHDERDLVSLNLVVHNPAYHPSERRLRESWTRLEGLMKILLA
jgi:hypothetical protein